MENIPCDLCGADGAPVVYTWPRWGETLPDDLALVGCPRCGLMYLNPRPGPEEIGCYYPPDYAAYRRAIEDEPFALMRWMRRRKLSKRRELIERSGGIRGGRVLDVGCATGLFLHEMTLAGWQATGVDMSPSAVAYARARFGLDVVEGQLKDARFPDASFDAITYWDVLEHTFSPRRELVEAARLLRPGGALALNVPDWESLGRRLFGYYWSGYDPPRHLYVFRRSTLARLLDEAGFTPAAWVHFMPSYFAYTFSIDNWLRVAAPRWAGPVKRLLAVPGMRLPFEPFFALLNRLQIGDGLTVIARKR